MTRGVVLARLLIAPLCVVATLSWLGRAAPSPNEFYSAISYSNLGEALIHRVPIDVDVSHRLPSSTILTAWLSGHRRLPPETVRSVLRSLMLVLALACGGLFLTAGLPLFFPALCVIFLAAPVVPARGAFQELYFSVLTLTLAGLLVWRSQDPSIFRSVLLSLCLGLSLVFRSVFAFLPPLILIGDYLLDRKTPRRLWPRVLLLGVLPYLWLLPWIKMNWGLHHRFIPFEHEGADMNIVAGALGLVQGFAFDYKQIVGDHDGPVLAWALREVWAHPIRYADGFLRRLAYAVSFQPWLFLLGAVSAWVHRTREECRSLVLLVAYILVLYCSMGVTPRYFEPLWPLLAVLAAALPARLLGDGPQRPRPLESSFAPAILISSLGLLLIPAFYAEAAVWGYPIIEPADLSSKAQAVERAIRRAPDEAWLWGRRGQGELWAGKLPLAVASFDRAAGLSPEDPAHALDAAWARALQGAPEALFAWEAIPEGPSAPTVRMINLKARLYKAVACLRAGRRSQAKRHLRAFIESHQGGKAIAGVETGQGDAVIKALVSSDEGLKNMVDSLIRYRPVSERLMLFEAIVELGPRLDLHAERAELLRARVDEQMRLNRKGEALRLLSEAERLQLAAQEAHRIALDYQDLHQYEQECRVLRRLIRDHPQEAVFWSDLGICLYRIGSTASSIGALRTAIRIDARLLPPYLSLGAIFAAEHRPREALELYELALRRAAKDERSWPILVKSRDELKARLDPGHFVKGGIHRE